ncbi:MAG: NERD domain-containing protein, partial [Synechococcaceae cyanobacterium SM2_3_2]|nr:NERD domain-containing protein [Synechococcaceae cyanobacterium SM2_3_2]
MTPGEKRVAEWLLKLPDDHLIWYDIRIPPKDRHPDFVVLSPTHGLLIIEVKDWIISQIDRADTSYIKLRLGSNVSHRKHPLEQARGYAHELENHLSTERLLIHPPSHPQHPKKLIFPYGFCSILTNIDHLSITDAGLEQIFSPIKTLYSDHLNEHPQNIFWSSTCKLLPFPCRQKLSDSQIEVIQSLLFPTSILFPLPSPPPPEPTPPPPPTSPTDSPLLLLRAFHCP